MFARFTILLLVAVGCSDTPSQIAPAPAPVQHALQSVAPSPPPEKPPAPVETTPEVAQGKQVLAAFQGNVVRIIDADSIDVLSGGEPVRVRLEGIDAPERGQEHSRKASAALSEKIHARTVQVLVTGTDKYGRQLGVVLLNGESINEWLVSSGWAWHYKDYSDDETLAHLEQQARGAKVGLWQHDSPIAPWEYRDITSGRAQRAISAPAPIETPAPASTASPPRAQEATARYWLNTNGGVRHNQRCRWFANTKRGRYCDADDGRACGICGG